MELFAGKTPAERNKIIAAIGLGALALIALYMAFGPSIRGKASAVTPVPSPSVPTESRNQNPDKFTIPNQGIQNTVYSSTPIVYSGVSSDAPETGRNIFAFYEPPPPTPYSPTPFPTPTLAKPTPTPPVHLAYFMPQNIFAGSGGFRMEFNGDKFTPETKVYFNQSQMPTSFVSPQRLTAEIPAAMIANEGPKTIIVQTPDGKLYSSQGIFNVQAPPKPQFQYIGMIARKRYNNDTAYFLESGKQIPLAARLNDVVGGRFRLMSVSADEAVLEDVNLGFRYKLALVKTAPVSSGNSQGVPGFPGSDVYVPYNPQNIPGIPNNIQRYVPPSNRPQQRPTPEKKDTDDDSDDTDN
jgi:hypothetical protein